MNKTTQLVSSAFVIYKLPIQFFKKNQNYNNINLKKKPYVLAIEKEQLIKDHDVNYLAIQMVSD